MMRSRAKTERDGLPFGLALLLAVATSPAAGLQRPSIGVEGSVTFRGAPVADAVAYLVPAPSSAQPVGQKRYVIDQRDLRFLPRVLPVPVGSAVEFTNSDAVLHNVFSPSGGEAGFDLGTYPSTESRTHVFSRPGVWVLLCHVHPEMAAYIVVVPNEFYAATAVDGRFRIEDVPAGDYVLHVWHARTRSSSQAITVTDGLRPIEVTLQRR